MTAFKARVDRNHSDHDDYLVTGGWDGAHRCFDAGTATIVPIIDDAELETVHGLMTRDGFVEFLGQCLQHIEKYIEVLREPPADPALLSALAHSMIGSAGVIGAVRVAALARRLEIVLEADEATAAAALTAQLIAAWAEAKCQLQQFGDFPASPRFLSQSPMFQAQ